MLVYLTYALEEVPLVRVRKDEDVVPGLVGRHLPGQGWQGAPALLLLQVDDFLVLEMKGQQPTGPTGYNKQSMKAAKELFAQREAEAALKPPTLMREATREPVGFSRGRGLAERGTDRGGRSFRGGGAGNSRNFRKVVNPNIDYYY